MSQSLISIPFARLNLGNLSQINAGYATLLQTATGITGFFTAPFTLPAWVDVSRPISAFAQIFAGSPPTVGYQVIVFTLRTVRVPPSGVHVGLTSAITFEAPLTWTANIGTRFELHDDLDITAPLFPANYFKLNDTVGFLLNRLGNEPGDSYAYTINTALYLDLLAYRRCQFSCC